MHKWDAKWPICVQTGFKSGAKIVKKHNLNKKGRHRFRLLFATLWRHLASQERPKSRQELLKKTDKKTTSLLLSARWQMTQKGIPLAFIFHQFWRLFGAFAPEDPSTFPKSQKGAQTGAPRVPQAAPPKLKGRHNEPRDWLFGEKTASVCNFFHIVFRWLSRRSK